MVLPCMARIKQAMEGPTLTDIPGSVREAIRKLDLRGRVKSGQTVAVTAGSRGIAKNTLDLAEMDVSESMLPEVQATPRLSQITQLAPVVFDREGNLSPF